MKIVQHILNCQHIYCRLIDLGVSKRTAVKICERYEKTFIHHLIYAKGSRKMKLIKRLEEIAALRKRMQKLTKELYELELTRRKMIIDTYTQIQEMAKQTISRRV